MQGIQEPGDRYIRQVDGYLVVEPALNGSAELEAVYRAFAVLCVKNQVSRALVKAADGNPEGERALRDAFTTMLLAGIPSGFKLALLAGKPGVEARYRNTQRDLTLAGIETRLFDTEEKAVGWLEGPGGSRRAA
jgi:hypothetical protein